MRRAVPALGDADAWPLTGPAFFQDPAAFDHLRRVALPQLRDTRGRKHKLRLWSAAAATGQEPYSLAMTLAEAAVDETEAEVFGTDITGQSLQRARAGLYTQYEVQRGLSTPRLLRFFRRDGADWRVAPSIRTRCVFATANILDESAALGTFDVVFCRHILPSFGEAVRRRVIRLIRQQLAPDGFLYVGSDERLSGAEDMLVQQGPVYVPLPEARPLAETAEG